MLAGCGGSGGSHSTAKLSKADAALVRREAAGFDCILNSTQLIAPTVWTHNYRALLWGHLNLSYPNTVQNCKPLPTKFTRRLTTPERKLAHTLIHSYVEAWAQREMGTKITPRGLNELHRAGL